MFLMDRTLISKIYLTSLVKHMKIVGTLQNFKICTKFFPPPQHNSIRVLNAIPKTNLGNKDWLLKTYHDGAHFLKQFLLFAAFSWLTNQRLSWCTHSVLNFVPWATILLLSAKQGSLGLKALALPSVF